MSRKNFTGAFDDAVIRNVLCYNSIGPNNNIMTNNQLADNFGSRIDIAVISNDWTALAFGTSQGITINAHLMQNGTVFTHFDIFADDDLLHTTRKTRRPVKLRRHGNGTAVLKLIPPVYKTHHTAFESAATATLFKRPNTAKEPD